MMAFRTRIKDARDAAKWRGHDMKRGEVCKLVSGRKVYLAECRDCTGEIYIPETPAANEADIAGECVAIGCNG